MEQIIFYLIIAIIVFDFLFERILDLLNSKHFSPTLPAALQGIYDQEKYKKSQEYLKANQRFSIITASVLFLLILIMLLLQGFAIMDRWVQEVTQNPYIQTLLFFGILGLGSEIITFPFEWYQNFVIEEKFGFNKTTPYTFITDKVKSLVIGAIIGVIILLFIQWAFMAEGKWFWLIAISGTGSFMIFMAMFYTSLILPLFNKLTPLEEGSLKNDIELFAQKTNFVLSNIYVMDGSKRSTKANAFFSGLGHKKKIILYDTLIKELTNKEIVAVLAHEIGHYKKRHIYKSLIFSLLQISLMLLLFWGALNTPIIAASLGSVSNKFYMGLTAFALLYSPVSFLMGIITNYISRKNEYQADAFSAGFGLSDELIHALIKLSVTSLSNLQPHPAYVFFYYSHPTLLQRKAAIERFNS